MGDVFKLEKSDGQPKKLTEEEIAKLEAEKTAVKPIDKSEFNEDGTMKGTDELVEEIWQKHEKPIE
jgi:hypothetical protein